MTMSTYGILLPCDGSEPMPISVGNHTHINELVGGHFDAISFNFDPALFDLAEYGLDGADGTPFVAVGYVHDEGILLDLPINPMASVVFQREICGPCVLVSGTSASGEYDGENHDIPEWFANAVFQGGLHDVSRQLMNQAEEASDAIVLALQDGLFTEEQVAKLFQMMASGDPKYNETIENALGIAVVYAMGRQEDVIPKFDRSAFNEFQESLVLTDDEIEKFWEENQ